MKQVFISSPLGNLEWRLAAIRAVEAVGLESVTTKVGSPHEFLSMRAEEVGDRVAASAVAVRGSSAAIFLMTSQWGTRISDVERTLLRRELRLARESGLPIFIYAHDDAPIFRRLAAGESTPSEISLIADAAGFGVVLSPEGVFTAVQRDLTDLLRRGGSGREVVILPQASRGLLRELLLEPNRLAQCDDRFFEELVADLLRADGWDVELVARLNAPGPDIVACTHQILRGHPVRMLVECKRYNEARRVDVREVRNLVYWLNEEYGATLGMIATTSSFTRQALQAVEERHRYRISLQDQRQLLAWLAGSKLLRPGLRSAFSIPEDRKRIDPLN